MIFHPSRKRSRGIGVQHCECGLSSGGALHTNAGSNCVFNKQCCYSIVTRSSQHGESHMSVIPNH